MIEERPSYDLEDFRRVLNGADLSPRLRSAILDFVEDVDPPTSEISSDDPAEYMSRFLGTVADIVLRWTPLDSAIASELAEAAYVADDSGYAWSQELSNDLRDLAKIVRCVAGSDEV